MYRILETPPYLPRLHSTDKYNDKGITVLEDDAIFHNQIDMFYFGSWEKLRDSYPILEEDPVFDWLDASTFAGTVHLHYRSSTTKEHCHCLTFNQYLSVLGDYMPPQL
jgi:hypothetical protein